jgi:hypothetical protein
LPDPLAGDSDGLSDLVESRRFLGDNPVTQDPLITVVTGLPEPAEDIGDSSPAL